MATPTPLHIKSAARKLPIKRKSPSQPISIPNPNPTPFPRPSSSSPPAPNHNHNFDDDDEDYEDDDPDAAASDAKQPPFKFHRIWPESDEIRFLQGLLGCWSQGMVFPRDLNIFYDRFSESMPQPYTRSQLSEKLRRLRKKFRTMAGRIARGLDASRLSQHDRDLLHLSTRLWDPSYASTSPFSTPDAVPAGSGSNKRRRPNPRALIGRPTSELSSLQHSNPIKVLSLPAPPAEDSVDPLPPFEESGFVNEADASVAQEENLKEESHPPPASSSAEVKTVAMKNLTMKSVLDVFDGALSEVRNNLAGQGTVSPDGHFRQEPETKDLQERWQEQRLSELELLAQRWRLVIEQSMQI